MAHWNFVGSQSTLGEIKAALQPGAIYLFHTLDADAKNLEAFIPYAISQGYRIVTLNEMFGLPENETAPLPAEGDPYYTSPTPAEYWPEYRTLKKGEYVWDVYLLQEKLLELGYLQYHEPTGFYGDSTTSAVYFFQLQHGLTADGVAGVETQRMLYSDAAERISAETIRAMEQETGQKYTDYSKQ